jgi:predicted metal-dependent hydrolase
VVIHELGHIASKSIGHTKEFWSTFKFILKEAVEMGLYKNVNYANNPQPYCGITVSSSVI